MSRIEGNKPVHPTQSKQQKPVPRELIYLSEQAGKTAGDAFAPAQANFARPPQTLAESGHEATRKLSKAGTKTQHKTDAASSKPFEAIAETFEAWDLTR